MRREEKRSGKKEALIHSCIRLKPTRAPAIGWPNMGTKKTSSSPEYRGRQESTIYAYHFFFFFRYKEEDSKKSFLILVLKKEEEEEVKT